MKRSTNSAPLSLSTSYLIGSAFIGISMITLNSSGALAPGVTLCRLMMVQGAPESADFRGTGPKHPARAQPSCPTDGKHHEAVIALSHAIWQHAAGAGPRI